ncbi:MAG: hypothetical protein HOI34_02310, partial [Rhodospirillaceae bacterium]|nr:hypothetical protein [Rhodospirillaceae bacterium]
TAQLSQPDGISIEIGTIGPGFPGAIRIDRITATDHEGVFMEVAGLEVLWTPWALLGGDVAIESATAASIYLEREPIVSSTDEEAPTTTSQSTLPQPLGIGLRLDELSVDTIGLGERITGREVAFAISGSVDLSGSGAGHTVLTVLQNMGGNASLRLSGAFDLAADTVDLELDVLEEAGGFVVELLDVPGRPALEITAELSGAASDFRGKLALSLGEDLGGALELEGAVAVDDVALKLDGTLVVAGLLDATTLGFVGRSVALGADLAFKDNILGVNSFGVQTHSASLGLAGSVALDDERLDLKITLEGRELDAIERLAAPLTLTGWRADAVVSGRLAEPRLGMILSLSGLEAEGAGVETVAVALEAAIAQDFTLWSSTLSVELMDLSTGTPELDLLMGVSPVISADLSGDVSGDQVTVANLSAMLSAGNISGALELTPNDGRVEIRSLVVSSDLASVSEILGAPLAGNLKLTAQGEALEWGDSVDLTLQAEGSSLSVGDPAGNAVIGDHPRLSATVLGKGDQWTLDAITLATTAWQAGGRGDVDLAGGGVTLRLDGPLDVTQELMAALELNAGAQGNMTLALGGTMDDPVLSARIVLSNANFDGTDLDGLALLADDVRLNPQLSARIGARVPYGTDGVTVAGNLAADEVFSTFMLNDLRIAGMGAALQGNLSYGLDNGLARGQMSGGISDLGALNEIAGGTLSGTALIDLVMDGSAAGGQDVALRLAMAGLAFDDMTVADARMAVDVSDVLNQPSLSLQASVDNAAAAGEQIDRLLIQANGPLDSLAMSLDAKGASWDLATRAHGNLVAGVDVEVSALSGSIDDRPLEAKGPFHFSMAGNDIALSGLELTAAGGTLVADIRHLNTDTTADVTLTGLPIEFLSHWSGALDLKGTLEGFLKLDANQQSARAEIELKGLGIGSKLDPDGDIADIHATAKWDGSAIDGAVNVAGIDGVAANIQVDWPVEHDVSGGLPGSPQDAPFSVALTVKGGLAEIWDRFPIGDQSLAGNLDVSVTASGTLASPRIDGTATVAGGRYENFTTGTIIEDMALQTQASSDGALELTASASDGHEGELSIKGSASFVQDQGLELDTTLSLDAFKLIDLDHASALAAGEVSYHRSLTGGIIKGQVTVDPVVLNVAQALPPEVVELDAQDVWRDKNGAVGGGESDGWSSSLDLRIDFPKRFYVQGRGLDTEWSGFVAVAGATNEPLVTGQLDMERGTVDVAGRRFELIEGNVRLAPDDDFDPTFLVVAQSKVGEMVGQLRVSGRVSAPKLDISSVPPLPEDEVLARTLFGKGASALSGLEAVQLASAIAGLTGRQTGGTGVLDRTRETLGVDVLRVDTDDEGRALIGAGSYIADGVYVGVEQGVGSDTSVVEVEIDVTDNITVNTEAGANATASVGVKWGWDY